MRYYYYRFCCYFQTGHVTGPEDEIFDDISERVSSRRRDGEDDMAYFERRYQERVCTLNKI